MPSVTAIRTRLAACPQCGHPVRLIVASEQATVSRCGSCGALQVMRGVEAVLPPAQAALAASPAAAGG